MPHRLAEAASSPPRRSGPEEPDRARVERARDRAPAGTYALIGAGRALSAIAGVVAVPVYTAYLVPAEYGAAALILALVVVANAALFHWAVAAIARLYPEHLARPEILLGAAVRIWLWSAAGVIAVGVIACGIAPAEDRMLLACAVVALLALSAHELVTEIARSELRPGVYAMGVAVAAVGGLAAGAAAAAHGARSAAPLIGLAVGTGIGAALQAYLLPIRVHWPDSRWGDDANRRALVRYGAPLAIALVISMAMPAAERFLITRLVDLEALGVYAAAYGLVFPAIVFLGSVVNTTGYPRIMRAKEARRDERIRRVLRQQAGALTVALMPAVVGVFLLAPKIAAAFPGQAYAGAAHLLGWIGLAAALNVWRSAYADLRFHLAKAPLRISACMLVALLVDACLNVLLLPRLGVEAAPLALLGAYGVALGLSIVLGRGYRALPWPPLRPLLVAAAATGVMAVGLAVVPAPRGVPGLVILVATGATIYFAILALAWRWLRGMADVGVEGDA